MSRLASRHGQVLVMSVLLLVVAMILVPLLVSYVQNEARWSVKQSRSSRAYHLAEAGQDRASWYLSQSAANWNSAESGSPPAGYAGDVQYSDVAGGLYDISFSSGPSVNEVTVTTKGKDGASKEVRAITAVYSDLGAGAVASSGLIYQGAFSLNSSYYVYWGQITDYTGITQSAGTIANTGCSNGHAVGGASYIPYYPYKRSAGEISPWDTSPTPPTSDATKNYAAYDKNLPVIPTVDFDYYRALAKNSHIPVPSQTGGQSAQWAGTGYFDGTGGGLNWNNFMLDCSTCVIFIENQDLTIGSGAGYIIAGAMIIYSGNLHIHSDGWYGYNLTPPSNAWQQYTAGTYVNPNGPGDTAAVAEYPGDCGYHTTCATYTVPNSSEPANATFTAPPFDQCGNTGLAFRGFLYANSFNCNGGTNVLAGQVYIGPGGSNAGTIVIYYDPSVGANVHYAGSGSMQRLSWREIAASWP